MSNDTFDRIKSELSIKGALESLGIPVNGKSKIRCPLPGCGDKDPSFSIYENDRKFKCHSCNASGSVVDLVMCMEGQTDKTLACKRCYELANIQYPANGNGNGQGKVKAIESTGVPIVYKDNPPVKYADLKNIPESRYNKRSYETRRKDCVEYYTYYTPDGEPHMQVFRMPSTKSPTKGDFPQYTWTGSYWYVGCPTDTPKYLYHQDKFKNSDYVVVVEGEKDVGSLEALGIPATTWPGGAGKQKLKNLCEKWDILAPLTGKTVFFIPDNDINGEIAFIEAAEFLVGKADELRKVTLPGVPDKGGDVSDFIKMHDEDFNVEQLVREELLKSPVYVPEPAKPPEVKPATVDVVPPIENNPVESRICFLADLLKEEIMPPEWVIPNLLPTGLVFLGGKSKAGKSWFTLNLCLSIAQGRMAFGEFTCEPQKVLYLSLEDHRRRLQYRGLKLNDQKTDMSKNLMYATKWPRFAAPNSTKKTNGAEGFFELKQALIQYGDIKLVAIDTWQKIRPSKHGNSDDYDRDYAHLGQMQELAQQHNCAVLMVHHARKDSDGADKMDSLLGSTAIQGCSDLIWMLDRKHQSSEGILTPAGRDIEDESPLSFSFNNGMWNYLGKKAEVEMSDNQNRIYNTLKESAEPLAVKDLAERSGVKKGSVNKALDALKEAGFIEQRHFDQRYCLKTL